MPVGPMLLLSCDCPHLQDLGMLATRQCSWNDMACLTLLSRAPLMRFRVHQCRETLRPTLAIAQLCQELLAING